MSHVPWAQTDWYADPVHPIAIGHIGIGIFNPGPQPVWDAEHRRAVVMAGEIYAIGERAFEANRSPEPALLALYGQYGDHFAAQINGAFICAIWDSQAQRLVLANDRFGLYPLYYTLQDRRLVFASEVKAIIAAPGFRRELDLVALAQYGRFQHLLGDRTFFEDVSQLAPATVLSFDLATGDSRAARYWTFADVPDRSKIGFAEAVEESGRLLRLATTRRSDRTYATGVYLSGGLDSRTLLGLMPTRPVHSFTYGIRNCRDVMLAKRIAQAAGSQHHWCDLPDGRWVLEHVDRHLELTEGFHSWIHSHGISTVDQAREHIQVNLSGWDGGQVMGHPELENRRLSHPVDVRALATHVFERMNQNWTWPGLTEAEEALLYRPAIWRRVRGLAFDSMREELGRFEHMRPDMRTEYFAARNHCGRLTQNMLAFYRTHVEVRTPYFDYAVFDFVSSLPFEYRARRRLYYAVIARETPGLATIPFDKEEYLPTDRAWLREPHKLGVKLRNRLGRYVPGLFPERPNLYADYENYLRHELREWAEGILFSPRTAERGLFDPAFLRSLMARHVSGRELWTIGKIAPLMTYEMMLRRLADDVKI
ncbi:MAG: hypothetical protein JNL73_16320 [Anaerolineales bacterium]|nr:hypothetical protein [Anaerolineales bacterium]